VHLYLKCENVKMLKCEYLMPTYLIPCHVWQLHRWVVDSDEREREREKERERERGGGGGGGGSVILFTPTYEMETVGNGAKNVRKQ
jgi:hypothetical protein